MNSDARSKAQALGASVGSGDYSGGSNSSNKKNLKDIDSSEINIKGFKTTGGKISTTGKMKQEGGKGKEIDSMP